MGRVARDKVTVIDSNDKLLGMITDRLPTLNNKGYKLTRLPNTRTTMVSVNGSPVCKNLSYMKVTNTIIQEYIPPVNTLSLGNVPLGRPTNH